MAISIQAQLKKVLAPFAKAVGVDIKKLQDTKQDKLKPGANITIAGDGTISATGSGEVDLSSYSTTSQVETLVNGKVAGLVQETELDAKLQDYAKSANVQTKLTAGAGVSISEAGVIAATAPDLTGYVKEEALDLGDLDLVAEYEAGKKGTEATVNPAQ